MRFLPDWDSIESTARWGDALFWIGITCLVLLAAAEVASHIFSNRSSALQAEGLQRNMVARVLTAKQFAALTGSLTEAPKPKAGIVLNSVPGNREAAKLASDLKRSFESAGFVVTAFFEDAPIGGAGSGILVRQSPKDAPAGVGIVAALNGVGLSARLVEPATPIPDSVEVIVGYAP